MLLSHKRAGRLVGSFGGWFLNRDFEAVGEEALSPPVAQRACCRVRLRGSRIAARDAAVRRPLRSLEVRARSRTRRERTFNEWSASVGLLLKPQAANDNFVIALNLARASRYPSLEELYYFGPHPGNLSFEIGNDELDAEHALGFRPVGARRAAAASRARSRSSATTSRTTSSGSRPATLQDAFPVVRNIEADSVLTGVEAHGDVKLTSEITAEVTYDMVRGELKDSGDPLPRIPPQRVLAGLTYQKNAFQVGGSAQIVSDQNRVFGEELPTEGYVTAKFFASYSFQRGGVLNTDHRASRQRRPTRCTATT